MFLTALIHFVCVSAMLAGELISIGTILSSPESYHLHAVMLQGTVRQVHPIPPHLDYDCGLMSDSYTFILEDATGSVEVAVRGACLKPGVVIPVSIGDRVVVQGLMHVFTPEGASQTVVQVEAREIRPLGH